MEDDIDIEEHDVLEHPKIRTIFPDLARIKIEAPDESYDGHPTDYEDEGSSIRDPQEEYTRHRNKIILGSKPTNSLNISGDYLTGESALIFGREPIKIKQEVPDYEDNDNHFDDVHPEDPGHVGHAPEDDNLYENNEYEFPKDENSFETEQLHEAESNENERPSVLILGTKPSADNSLEDASTEQDNSTEEDCKDIDVNDIKASSVVLTDWGPILDNSACYCKDCEILFPTTNTLNAHKMVAHSFLVAVEMNKAVKSTAKPAKSKQTEKFCNHCNKMFPDSNTLISHLYETLTADKQNVFKKEAKPQKDPKAHKAPIKGALSSKLFLQCKICFRYLKTKDFFASHMQEFHSETVTEFKYVGFNPKCAFCKWPNSNYKTYNNHLYKCRARKNLKAPIVSKPIPQNSKSVPKDSDKTAQYSCRLCHATFNKYDEARTHRRVKHPNTKNISIFNRIVVGAAPSLSVKKTSLVSKPMPKSQKALLMSKIKKPQATSTVTLVPKSVLFKCGQCQLNFTSCTALILHTKSCLKEKPSEGIFKCKTCGIFEIEDKKLHQLQHLHCRQFNVYIYDENMYGRVLNRCPDCYTYLHEQSFANHQYNGCNGGGVFCPICELTIHESCVEDHATRHEMLGPMTNEIILVDFEKVGRDKFRAQEDPEPKTSEPTKRKASEPIETGPKRARVESRHYMYYCRNCECYMCKLRYKKNHLSGMCQTFKRSKCICNICGLMVSSKIHQQFHEEKPGVKLSHMTFVGIHDGKVMNPPIPKFPRCPKCKVHFCKRKTLQLHNCRDAQKTCKYCKLKFSDLAYKLHVRFHEYSISSKQAPAKKTVSKTSPQVLPELLKKYEMLTNTWNILYLCITCDIACDSYDLTVEHSQKHFNSMENYDVIVQQCDACDLKFDNVCYEKHKELHSRNKTINANSFNILKYDHAKLFKSIWADHVFGPLDSEQALQIESRSLYAHTRSVKMRIVQDGAPESTIFCCGKCKKYVHPRAVSNHYTVMSCDSGDPLPCRVCKLPFSSLGGKIHHQNQHETSDDFRVVMFNEAGSEIYDQTLRNHSTKYKGTGTSSDRNKIFHFYVCSQCNLCIVQKTYSHICSPATLKHCKICNLYFNHKSIYLHMELHKLNPHLNKKYIQITMFTPNSESAYHPATAKVKLYKCDCGLHFTSNQAAEKHTKICKTNTEISKENCSKCNLLFDTTQLVTHLCKHHSNEKKMVFDVVNINDGNVDMKIFDDRCNVSGPYIPRAKTRETLYKCNDCDVYYVSEGGIRGHFKVNHDLRFVSPCPQCKLNFPRKSLASHIMIHHKQFNFKAADYHIKIIKGPQTLSKPAPLKTSNPQQQLIGTKTPQLGTKNLKLGTNPRLGTKVGVGRGRGVKQKFTCSKKRMISLNMNKFSNAIFKCQVCRQCLLKTRYIKAHKRLCPGANSVKCGDCGYIFTIYTIDTHKYVHHQGMKLKREDLKVVFFNRSGQTIDDQQDETEGEVKRQIEEFTDFNVASTSNDNRVAKYRAKQKIEEIESDPDTDMSQNDDDTASSQNSRFEKSCRVQNLLLRCHCGLHFLTEGGLTSHILRAHTNNEPQATDTCKLCGLDFTLANLSKHLQMHHETLNLTREDLIIIPNVAHDKFQFVNRYVFKCHKCGMHFGKIISLEQHEAGPKCSTRLRKCGICGLDYFSVTERHYAIHEIFEKRAEAFIVLESTAEGRFKLVDPTSVSENTDCLSNTNDKEKSKETIDIESDNSAKVTSLRPRRSLNRKRILASLEIDDDSSSSWQDSSSTSRASPTVRKTQLNSDPLRIDLKQFNKQVYKCVACSIHFVTSSTVEKHLSMKCCGKSSRQTCEICSLDFPEVSLVKHIRVHHEIMNLSREDLEIVPHYDSNNRIYRCGTCSLYFVSRLPLSVHSCRRTAELPKATCEECDCTFAAKALQKHISLHHRQLGLKREDYCIINEKKEIVEGELKYFSFNPIREKTPDDIEEEPEELTNEVSTVNPDLYTNKLYKCGICSLHFLTKRTEEWHTNNSKHDQQKSKCSFCRLDFATKHLPAHVFVHHTKLNLSAEHFCVTSNEDAVSVENASIDSVEENNRTATESPNGNTEKVLKTYSRKKISLSIKRKSDSETESKPSCSNKITKLETTEQSIESLKSDINTESGVENSSSDHKDMAQNVETCSEIKLIAKEDKSESIALNESQKPDEIPMETQPEAESVIISDSPEKVQKAEDPELECVTAETSVVPKRPSIVPRAKVPDLESPVTDTSVFESPERQRMSEEIDMPIKLYKCSHCNVCFLTQMSCYKHVTKHIPLDPKDYIECKLCGYQFIIINSLHKHIARHHREKFKPENVLIEEYHPNILCHGSPKIDIYFGTDKVQSKLISTTSDGSVEMVSEPNVSKSADNSEIIIYSSLEENEQSIVNVEENDVICDT